MQPKKEYFTDNNRIEIKLLKRTPSYQRKLDHFLFAFIFKDFGNENSALFAVTAYR